jgi:uncharacterized membrane protein
VQASLLISTNKKPMNESPDDLSNLGQKIENLLKAQDILSKELNTLRFEFHQLKARAAKTQDSPEAIIKSVAEPKVEVTPQETALPIQQPRTEEIPRYKAAQLQPPRIKQDLEKFIGENLINKIGIAITVIGVAIGAKYSIDHQLISPLTRIVLGYLAGLALLGVGIRLKKNYENYSSVLVSGAIAILYFITYAAYAFYNLFPQVLAFALMFLFTAFAVVAAINYNRQVIAHIGLVGAYAVPFLLSDGSGRVGILFTYMAIINIGVMVIASRKYWKSLYLSAFIFSWLIFGFWYNDQFQHEQFTIAFSFMSIFFVTFYVTFLVYKISHTEKFELEDILLLMANSFVFYGLGYSILSRFDVGSQMLGVFTVGNAVIHFIVSVILYKRKLADKNMFYFIVGLVLVFITIAIPVQLDGNWVTLLWAGEAALLFWIGRTKAVSIYETLSYPLILLAFMSLILGWMDSYSAAYISDPETRIAPILNIRFLTSILVAGAFAFISWLNSKTYESAGISKNKDLCWALSFSLPAIFLFTLYMSFNLEISAYWGQLESDSAIKVIDDDRLYPHYIWNTDLGSFKIVWLINYAMVFFSVLSFVNIRKIKNAPFAYINLLLNTLALFCFLTIGLYDLSELRDSYLEQAYSEYFKHGSFNIVIRYISIALAVVLVVCSFLYIRGELLQKNMKKAFDIVLYAFILWVSSSELIHWLQMGGSDHSYKLGLSILWGLFSLLTIAIGIWKHKKHLRIGAIVLFAITLLKLFIYDISSHNTVAKTILFVSLGVLLLVISFLYNKYKHIISDEPKA